MDMHYRRHRVQVTVTTPWVPVETDLVLRVLPVDDDASFFGSKRVGESLGIDLTSSLRNIVHKSSNKDKERLSSDQVAPVALAR